MPEQEVAPHTPRVVGTFSDGTEQWACCPCCETPDEPGVCYFNTQPNQHTCPCPVCEEQ